MTSTGNAIATNSKSILPLLCFSVIGTIFVFILNGRIFTGIYTTTMGSYEQILWVPRQKNGYLSSTYGSGMSGGLGNNLFELLTVIGVADQLNRFPYIRTCNDRMMLNMGYRIRQLFPLLEQQFKIVYWNITEQGVQFNAGKCCVFDNPERLRGMTDEYIVLQGAYFQSFKYFDHLRTNVRQWLTPNATILQQAEAHMPLEYKERFLICVHIRRGDFITDGMHEGSDGNFSINAMTYLMKKYYQSGRRLGIVVMGDDKIWGRNTFSSFRDVFIIDNTREQDLAFTQKYCEVFLITAPSSTFGFFLGYLSKNFTVYYRDILTTKDRVQNEMNPIDFYPPSWKKIREVNEEIVELPS